MGNFVPTIDPVLFAVSNLLMLYVYANYFLAKFVDPGVVPVQFSAELQGDACINIQSLPFCKKCNHYKPPRAHHCSVCNRCILAMDHHCPWTGSCVGFFNYPHFFRFLFFVILNASILLVINVQLLQSLTSISYYDMSRSDFSQKIHPVLLSLLLKRVYQRQMLLLANCILLGIVFISILILFIRQNVLSDHEKANLLQLESLGRFPYNLGFVRNVCSVFNIRSIFWLPIALFSLSHRTGDGITFEANMTNAPKFIRWPPLLEALYFDSDDDCNGDSDECETSDDNDVCRDNKEFRRVRRDSEGYVVYH